MESERENSDLMTIQAGADLFYLIHHVPCGDHFSFLEMYLLFIVLFNIPFRRLLSSFPTFESCVCMTFVI